MAADAVRFVTARPPPIGESAAVTLLLAKVLLSPLCVIAVSMVGRRWGVAVAGVLGGLPMVAGPILLVETLVHGRDFGADAAAGTLLGLVALTAFVVVYERVAELGPIRSVLCGWAAFLAGIALLNLVHPPLTLAAALAAGSFWVGLRLLPPASAPGDEVFVRPWWDLPLRALAALTLVLLVGFYGFAAFCLTLALALPGLATAAAFGLAVAAALAVQLTVLVLRAR